MSVLRGLEHHLSPLPEVNLLAFRVPSLIHTNQSAKGSRAAKKFSAAVQRQKAVTLFLVENELLIFLAHSRPPSSCG